MMKRVILLVFCIMIAVGGQVTAASPETILTEEEALVKAFESTGAEVLESTISCWTKLNSSFMSIKQVETEMSRIEAYIKPDMGTVVRNVEGSEQLNKIVMYCSKADKSYSVAIESIKQGNIGETYIVFDVSMDKSYGALKDERHIIAAAMKVEEASINFSSCIIGTYKGKLEEREADKKSRIALQSINARKVEGIEDNGMKSISAFSSNVDSFIMSNQARVNVQLAIRYSAYEDKTYIWIGTPIIPVEY